MLGSEGGGNRSLSSKGFQEHGRQRHECPLHLHNTKDQPRVGPQSQAEPGGPPGSLHWGFGHPVGVPGGGVASWDPCQGEVK